MASKKPALRLVCPKCEGRQYTAVHVHDNGSATFTICPCSGLTAERLKGFIGALGKPSKPKLRLVPKRARRAASKGRQK